MYKHLPAYLFLGFCCLMPNLSKAQLIGVSPSYPQINFVNTDPTAVSYDPISQVFTLNALPYNIVFSESDAGDLIVSNNTISITLDTDGSLLSGTNGFNLTGTFTRVSGGETNSYSGTLLTGDVVAFGYLYSGSVNQFDFSVQLTGGEIQSLFGCASLFGITMTSEDSNFTNSFTTPFNGAAKGYCGPEDVTPPTITCPPLSEVVTTPTNGGFIVTYPNPIVNDNCDPSPTIFCDTPSGSFVALSVGQTLTINCYGIDVSGNYSECSFTVTMGQSSGTCPLEFVGSGCAPVTLPADPGECSALYTFSLPIATNCSGQTFEATATAVDESGVAITLTNLGNGTEAGVFPHTVTSNGDIITFTASDGSTNQVVQQCQVFVDDTQPPVINCVNQTATFKPILTNAVSCIQASFNNTCIPAGDYIWFNSVIRDTWCQNNPGAFTVHIFGQTIVLTVDNTNITLDVPDAYVYFSNGVSTSTTIFTNGEWMTWTKPGCSGNTFAAGLAWQVPFNLNNLIGGCWGRDPGNGPFRRHVSSVTWCAQFAVDTPGVALEWQWGAVVESSLPTNYNSLGVKSCDLGQFSCWQNSDPAGACENFKSRLLPGACGAGCRPGNPQGPDCTGILSSVERCNLGLGTVCEGAVDFKTPLAYDNCDPSVKVTCEPPSGSIFGPGDYTITCTAVDSSGNSNQCAFTLTVVPPIQVIFDSPTCDNIADNIAQPDAGFTDMNCPDSPSTPEYINCFHVGNVICHQVRLLDCNGNDVTTSLASCVTVHIDVTERKGSFGNSALVSDCPQNYVGVGSPGGLMIPCNGAFQYNLATSGFQSGTVNTSCFFRSCVWVEYNSSPGVPVGMEDVILESY